MKTVTNYLRILLLTGFILLSFKSFCQKEISGFNNNLFERIELKEVSVKEVFDLIESKTDYDFFYKRDFNALDDKVTIEADNKPVDFIIEELSKQTNLSFQKINKIIAVTEKESENKGTGTVTGKIIDEEGMPLIGASIIIKNFNKGTVADVNGNYQILGLNTGTHIFTISFIGYKGVTKEIEVVKNKVITVDFVLTAASMEIGEAVAYGQATGQAAAINQQLNSDGIVNVVSAEKLQELPDVNVAEAVGRLPGMMVERNRGEGQKIIIRGLAPKYNTISVGGNLMPSTSPDDRSTDLNLIAPEILSGVEVQKANTADKDAEGLGGTVNLSLKEAPSGLKVNAGVLTGYSGHSQSLGNYRFTLYASNRFFKDKLGVMITGNADIAERNSDRFGVSYDVQGVPNYEEGETFIKPWITNASVEANVEDRTRYGGSVLLDWKISPTSTIKSTNFVGYLNREIYDRTKNYNLSSGYINFTQYQNIINQLVLTNSIEGDHLIRNSVLDWGASLSQSKNEKPEGHKFEFRLASAYEGYAQGQSFDVEPPELLPHPDNVNDYLDRYIFQNGRMETYNSDESELSLYLNWKQPFKLGEKISGYIKVGTKFREKERSRSNDVYNGGLSSPDAVNEFLKVYPDYTLTTEGVTNKISIVNFLDESYKPRDFLYGNYEYLAVDYVLDRDLMKEVYNNFLKDHYFHIPAGAQNDYKTYESVFANYLMAEFKFGKYITFIPGLRHEQTSIKYNAYIAESIPESESAEYELAFEDTTATNSYGYFFPQMHLKIEPLNWLDFRLAYTHTLSKPDYNQLAPKRIISVASRKIDLGNTQLKPALSKNFDAIATIYKPRLGFLSIGAFYKEIENFLWTREALVVAGTRTDPEILKVPESSLGYSVFYPLNNPNQATIKGVEFDLQSNMLFLPVKGFVLSLNLTAMESQTRYQETLIERQLNPDYGVVPGAPRVIFANNDTAYVDRLLSQPSYLANVGIGYDNKKIGLSIRLSFNFQDDILTKEQRRPDGADREGTLEFYRWDFQFKKRIVKRLSITGNVTNIFNQPDKNVRLLTGYLTSEEYYGYMAYLGLKYTIY